MMNKITRRTFLKTAGTAVLAVAAAGALTACSDETPAPAPSQTFKPTYIQPEKPETNETNVDISDFWTVRGTSTHEDNSKTLYGIVCFKIKNTGKSEMNLSADIFDVKVDNQLKSGKYLYKQTETYGLTSKDMPKTLAAGASANLAVSVEVDSSLYAMWYQNNHEITLTVKNNDASADFKFSTKA